MKILSEYVSNEFCVKGSRFLAELFPCEEQSFAKELIKSQKIKYADSTHVVHAFIIGKNAEIMGMSDDGEPSGTAGRPALDVLKGFSCTDILLTITRWFGGTLLGTGGLVKVYGDSAKQVLSCAEKNGSLKEFIKKTAFSFRCSYSFYQTLKHIMPLFEAVPIEEKFESEVFISCCVPEKKSLEFCKKIQNLSNGTVQAVQETPIV